MACFDRGATVRDRIEDRGGTPVVVMDIGVRPATRLEQELEAENERLREALGGMLASTDHRSMNEQVVGGDDCDCSACIAGRAALSGERKP